MATHDYVIANQGFPAFRSDLNNALAAIVSNNSSATEPTTMFAHMIWVDTAANPSILKIRNADNDAWITIGTINQTADTFTLTSAVSATTLNTSGAVVFNDAGADVDFRVEGDTEANLLFVDASTDRVGIGTSAPVARLDVVSSSTPTIRIDDNAGSGTRVAGRLFLGNTGGDLGVSIENSVNGFNDNCSMVFKTTAPNGTITPRMTLDSSGNLLVGTTSAFDGSYRGIQAINTSDGDCAVFTTTGVSGTMIRWNKATSGDNLFINFYTETSITLRGSISYNRAGGLVAYNTTSDYRAKDITGPVTGSGALIDSIPVYMGTMKGATQERPMFIAHETPAYAHTGEKDAVDKDGNPVYQQMDASALIPVMWAEIQELRKRLAAAGI